MSKQQAMLPNDYSRCTGTNCDRATQCQRFTDKGTGDRISMHDAAHGCIGFIEVVKPVKQKPAHGVFGNKYGLI
jgi:hypothetical protein